MRAKKNSLLFASYPASGWNWSVDVLSYALGLELMGSYEIKYVDAPSLKEGEIKPFRLVCAADARASGAVPLYQQLPGTNIDFCYHTHGYWGESPLWRLNEAKLILITRDLPTSLFSQYSKRRLKYKSFEEFLDSENGLEKIVRYYNSWGDLCSRKDESCYHLTKYEDMRVNTLDTFKALGKFCFDLNIEDAKWIQALDYYSFEKQKEREKMYNTDDRKHFHYKGKTDYKEEMSEDVYKKITDYLRAHLRHDFGYNY